MRLLHSPEIHNPYAYTSSLALSNKRLPLSIYNRSLLHIPPQIPLWRQAEQDILINLGEEQLHLALARSQRAQAYIRRAWHLYACSKANGS